MIIHLICIGDELLCGDTLNTNFADLGALLASHGLAIAAEQCIPDERTAILEALAHASRKAEAVLLVGGLGPTQDDLTRPVTAEFLGRALRPSPAVRQTICDFLGQRATQLPAQALDLQSQVPEGADILPNPNGTAPGLAITQDGILYALLPGPPRECLPMAAASLLPRLLQRAGTRRRTTLELRICGLPESQAEHLAQQALRTIPAATEHIRQAICIKPDCILLRFSRATADEQAAPLLPALRQACATVFGAHLLPEDCPSSAAYLGRLLVARNLTLATAESCTGGLISASLTAIPGSSEWFVGAVVTYANAWKQHHLGVEEQTLMSYGAVSEQTVQQMLDGLQERCHVPAGIAVSGIAGPGGGTPAKPVGTVVIGAFAPGWRQVQTVHFSGQRQTVRQRAVYACLQLLLGGLIEQASTETP